VKEVAAMSNGGLSDKQIEEYLLESTDRLVKFAGNLNDNPGRLRVVSASGCRDAKKDVAEAIVRLQAFEKLLTGRDHVVAKKQARSDDRHDASGTRQRNSATPIQRLADCDLSSR
jgi:hypothetical protein